MAEPEELAKTELEKGMEAGNYIYRRIEYKPRIWGLEYIKLFSCLGFLALSLMVLRGAVGFAMASLIGVSGSAGMYGYFFYKDNVKESINQGNLNRIKDKVAPIETSNTKVKFKNKAISSKVKV